MSSPDGPHAVVAMITMPGTVSHAQYWEIPPGSAAAFAAAMTERYGPPVQKAVASEAAMEDVAAHAERAGFMFFTPAPEVPR